MEKLNEEIKSATVSKSRRKDSDASEPEKLHMLPEELRNSFRSKKDLYDWFTFHLQIVLPPIKECRMSKFTTSIHR